MLRLTKHTLPHHIRPLLLRPMLSQKLDIPPPRIAQIRIQQNRLLEPTRRLLQAPLAPKHPRDGHEQDRIIIDLLDSLKAARFTLACAAPGARWIRSRAGRWRDTPAALWP